MQSTDASPPDATAAGLPLLYCDDDLLVVNKPPALAAHRSNLVGDDDDYLIDRLRRQVGGSLYLAHRLDRATSGALVVARSTAVATEIGRQLMDRSVEKAYLAVVRGWPDETGTIDHPLTGSSLKGAPKPAVTHWRRLARVELPIPMGRYPQQRYSLLEVQPQTGRYQQIRRHFAHISHHLVGDTTHGRGDHNRLFRIHWAMHRLLLHAWRVGFTHPVSGQRVAVSAPLDASWNRILDTFGWQSAIAGAAPKTDPHG
ncbi:pseudouridine synthase [Tahibacter amnicola]|uniref:tRNA pseudouridine synthase C n=1 Tax=Tahibacter amnicola TaxID=2976241 RepID=A0ABY6BF00_9GAMM|nr:pseudouridine synthase [Tahibacter amnicola]UXI68385.1 pseudouridine synthase [Tahibacter amnicola]